MHISAGRLCMTVWVGSEGSDTHAKCMMVKISTHTVTRVLHVPPCIDIHWCTIGNKVRVWLRRLANFWVERVKMFGEGMPPLPPFLYGFHVTPTVYSSMMMVYIVRYRVYLMLGISLMKCLLLATDKTHTTSHTGLWRTGKCNSIS